ncbi:MAG: hypothetical protein HPY81_02745 [Firmicutes bacterium]|nr:hypothetical protein [Bacillota bacterium]
MQKIAELAGLPFVVYHDLARLFVKTEAFFCFFKSSAVREEMSSGNQVFSNIRGITDLTKPQEPLKNTSELPRQLDITKPPLRRTETITSGG